MKFCIDPLLPRGSSDLTNSYALGYTENAMEYKENGVTYEVDYTHYPAYDTCSDALKIESIRFLNGVDANVPDDLAMRIARACWKDCGQQPTLHPCYPDRLESLRQRARQRRLRLEVVSRREPASV